MDDEVPSAGVPTLEDWRGFLTSAYIRFHDAIEAGRDKHPGLTPYDIVRRAGEVDGSLQWHWGVPSEIQETINAANAWSGRLQEWGAWNSTLDAFATEEERWEVSRHFIEPIAFFCMLQPSSFADRLIVVAENLLHQANLQAFHGEPDRLKQDDLGPEKVLRRKDRLKQLNSLGRRWGAYGSFRRALNALNGAGYKKVTRNFRDLSVHSFAPRLFIGHISRALRSVVPRTELEKQADGSYLEVAHPTKKSVQYAMAELPPLSLGAMRDANLIEYQRASLALEKFSLLLDEVCERLAKK